MTDHLDRAAEALRVAVDDGGIGGHLFRDDGSNGWLVTHHSLDGRERREESQ